MSTILRVRLSGADAHLGRVPASDVVRLLLGVERVVARATGAVRSKPAGGGKSLNQLSGSASLSSRRAASSASSSFGRRSRRRTPWSSTRALGELALAGALNTAAGQGTDAEVARALIDLADRLSIGSRYEAITFQSDVAGAPPRVVLDANACERLHHVADRQLLRAEVDAFLAALES